MDKLRGVENFHICIPDIISRFALPPILWHTDCLWGWCKKKMNCIFSEANMQKSIEQTYCIYICICMCVYEREFLYRQKKNTDASSTYHI